ncbi:hypothetical protein KVV02_003707 [Mortierella alpina]|uniref:intramembrane prenyl-peptidase Rce1 n=1 Tax=Mortierella alpina TaxID=64518 RepID=A0A9P8ABJ1_MORAP|nr:hypothetical protein KVV02_003707 [Mortierella alpina]
MSTFDPVISPWLAAGSCVGFTFMFVGSLYVFPLKTKQQRARERYVPLANWDEPPPDTGDAAEARRENNITNHHHNNAQPLSSPRPSSSSVFTFENGPSIPMDLSSSNSSNTIILTTKSPTITGVADSRAHRISTHLNFIETTTSSTPTTASPRSSVTASTLGLISPSSSAVSPSVATFTSSISSILATSGSVARPEVAIHPHTSSQFDQTNARYQSPVDNQKLDRDHPLVIVQRFKGILLTCFLVPLYLWWLLTFSGAMPTDLSFWGRLGHFLRMLGISIPGNILKLFNHAVIPLFLTSILFMGPVLMMFLSNELPFQQAFDWASQRQHLRGLIGTRNFVVGPVSEEFIFRACMVAIMAHSGASSYVMIFGLPWVFGIAHLHHGYESYVKKGRTRGALLSAALTACLQLAYTTLFGWFAIYLFLRTSNLVGPCLCHAFCNMMGFPDVTNIQYYGRWKYWLYLAFVTGIALFGVLLRPLTSPALYGDPDSSAYWRIVARLPDVAA